MCEISFDDKLLHAHPEGPQLNFAQAAANQICKCNWYMDSKLLIKPNKAHKPKEINPIMLFIKPGFLSTLHIWQMLTG